MFIVMSAEGLVGFWTFAHFGGQRLDTSPLFSGCMLLLTFHIDIVGVVGVARSGDDIEVFDTGFHQHSAGRPCPNVKHSGKSSC